MVDQFARALDHSTVGYSYAVYWNGEPLVSGGHGMARPASAEGPIMMNSATRLQIASASKPITAVALLHEMERKGLSIDTSMWSLINEDFPDVQPSESVRNVTVRQLLTHTSGYEFGYIWSPRLENTRALLAEPVPHPPDKRRYSNINFALARAVLEALSGQPYESYVRSFLLEKVDAQGMSLRVDSVATPYSYAFAGKSDAGAPLAIDFSDDGGPYGWYATAEELVRFLNGVREGAFLSPEWTATMLEEGLGWGIQQTSSGPAYRHEGQWAIHGNRGVRSGIAILPDNVEAAVLTATNGLFSMTSIITKAFDACSVNAYSLKVQEEFWVHADIPRHADRVRWTDDGSIPTADSREYDRGIKVPASATVRVQGFWKNRPVTFVRTLRAGIAE